MKSILGLLALVALISGEKVKIAEIADVPHNNEEFKVKVVESSFKVENVPELHESPVKVADVSEFKVKIVESPFKNANEESKVKVVESPVVEDNEKPIFEDSPVHGYLTKVAIPQAQKIKLAEELIKAKNSRIVGGLPTTVGQFAYHAGLLSDIIGISGNGVCGGVLVSDSKVLTAAHCWNDGVNQAWRLTVVLGSNFLFTGGQRIATSVVAVHPNWSSLLVRNDIGVIYLPNAVATNNDVQPVALPHFYLNELFTGSAAIITGYGATTPGGGITNAQSLHYVPLAVISNTVCFISYPLYITSAHVCTSGSAGIGPCSGDSGGPLVVQRPEGPVLIGITSFGSSDGCAAGSPTAYTRVTEQMDFIQQHL